MEVEMNKISTLLHFGETSNPDLLSVDFFLRRAEFALQIGEYLDAKADALSVIALPDKETTSAQLMRTFIVLLHAQSALTNNPSLDEEQSPPLHFTMYECKVLAGMACLFATNPSHPLQERCVVHLGLARYYQYLNWQKNELESVTEVRNLCAELGDDGREMLGELQRGWPALFQ
jgi:hypothetical protein